MKRKVEKSQDSGPVDEASVDGDSSAGETGASTMDSSADRK